MEKYLFRNAHAAECSQFFKTSHLAACVWKHQFRSSENMKTFLIKLWVLVKVIFDLILLLFRGNKNFNQRKSGQIAPGYFHTGELNHLAEMISAGVHIGTRVRDVSVTVTVLLKIGSGLDEHCFDILVVIVYYMFVYTRLVDLLILILNGSGSISPYLQLLISLRLKASFHMSYLTILERSKSNNIYQHFWSSRPQAICCGQQRPGSQEHFLIAMEVQRYLY